MNAFQLTILATFLAVFIGVDVGIYYWGVSVGIKASWMITYIALSNITLGWVALRR